MNGQKNIGTNGRGRCISHRCYPKNGVSDLPAWPGETRIRYYRREEKLGKGMVFLKVQRSKRIVHEYLYYLEFKDVNRSSC